MKKRFLLTLAAACLLLSVLAPAAYAAETSPTDVTIPEEERSEAVFQDPTTAPPSLPGPPAGVEMI